jgi:hypothetical protein
LKNVFRMVKMRMDSDPEIKRARKGMGVGRVSFLIVFLVLVASGVVAFVVAKGLWHDF